MSISIDLFLADASEAERLASADNPFDQWPNCSLQGVTNFELIVLARILGCEPGTEHLHGDGEDAPLVLRIPDGMVRKLAALTPAERDHVAPRWRNEAEGFNEWLSAEVAEVLTQLCTLAESAVRTRKAVLQLASL